MTDAFTSASMTYQRAQSLGSRPMPLAAGEVATYRRPRHLIRIGFQFVAWCVGLGMLWAVLWRFA